MIITKNTVGASPVRGGSFLSQKGFASRRPTVSTSNAEKNYSTLSRSPDNTTVFRLFNTEAEFIFEYDPITGVRLSKFRSNDDDTYFINHSRKLWELCIRRQTVVDVPTNYVFVDKYFVRPTRATFSVPSVIPVSTSEGKTFVFRWKDVPYNYKNRTKTCSVSLTAFLPKGSPYLEMSVSVEANHAISSKDVDVCISAVGMPSLSLRKRGANQSQDYISLPITEGSTILDPIKRLAAPRFDEESFQFNENATKTYLGAGLPGNPLVRTLKRGNFGSPGQMSVPLIIFGNRTDKRGFIYYAMDPDLLHSKQFQYFSDGYSMHIRTYDISDHEIDPYGMGGKVSYENVSYPSPVLAYGNRKNTIGWKVRIRPYTSPTIWGDWYATTLYKKEVVPELEASGVIPKSFKERYLSGYLDKRDSEVPFIAVHYGYLSGSVTPSLSGNSYLQNLYKDATYPSTQQSPKVITHFQPVSLNNLENTGSIYYGWEQWASKNPISTKGQFLSPDISGFNNNFASIVSTMQASGQSLSVYTMWPFLISSGSNWTRTHSGMDLITKSPINQSKTFTTGDYKYYLVDNQQTIATGEVFSCCIAPTLYYDKHVEISRDMSNSGLMQFYFDTAGAWSRGCYAESHQYYHTGLARTVSLKHPRAGTSHYFNRLQYKAFTGARGATLANRSANWPDVSGSVFNPSFFEHICDANIPVTDGSLLYNPTSAIYATYFSPLSLTNPLWSGSPRGDAIWGSLGTVYYNVVAIEPPNWLQTNPIFTTIYGDRQFISDWFNASIGNHLLMSGACWPTEPAGTTSIYGYPDSRIPNDSGRYYQNKNWVASRINMLPRITATYQYRDYSGIDSRWVPATPEMSGAMNAPVWSGMQQFTRSICRLLAYAPDHMYHGYAEHPLESWTVGNDASAYGPRVYRSTRIPNASGWLRGDDKVIHGVRRHHSNDSVVLWIANWTSGSAFFSGSFDPAAYEFESGYGVTQIDLSDTGNGTLSNFGLYSYNTPYSVVGTLAENEIRAYIIDPTVSLYTDTEINSDSPISVTTNFAYVRYAYGQQELSTNNTSVVYEYGSQHVKEYNPPSEGYKAPMTQAIANNLPQWLKLRQDVTSTGWMLVNSWAQNLEEVLDEVKLNVPNKFVSSSDTSLKNLVNYFDITNEELLDNRVKDNLLFNTDFTISSPARYELPAGWSDYATTTDYIQLSLNKPFITANSIKATGSGKFGQTAYLDNAQIKDLTASIYLLSNAENTVIKLLTSIEMLDGSILHKQSLVTTRSAEWRRLTHTVPVNGQVYRVQFMVFTDCSDTVYFNAPKLEASSFATKWSAGPTDYLPYLTSSSIFNAVYVIGNESTSNKKIPLYPISSEEEFLRIDVPTRIEKFVVSNPEDLYPFTTDVKGRKISYFNEIFDVRWVVEDDKVKMKSYGINQFDTFRELGIRDLSFDEGVKYGTYLENNLTTKPLLSCIKGNKLYVLCLETYYGYSKYVVKIVEAVEPLQDRDYLESLIDFDLDLPLNQGQFFNESEESPVTLAFSEVDPTCMVVTTNLSRQFYYKLHFDYYFYASAANRVYTIESYNESKIQVM